MDPLSSQNRTEEKGIIKSCFGLKGLPFGFASAAEVCEKSVEFTWEWLKGVENISGVLIYCMSKCIFSQTRFSPHSKKLENSPQSIVFLLKGMG